MPPLTRIVVSAAALVVAVSPALAAEKPEGAVRIATWNIENWTDNFQAYRDRDQPQPATEEGREARAQVGYANDEDNWEVAQTILSPDFHPDVLVFQEGCSQEELDYFAGEWLGDDYPTRIVFPTNSDRGQTIGLMAREGFEILETKDQYHLLPDEKNLNPRSDYLFARGPAFVKMKSPGGDEFWVGVTHQKSKSGNSVETTIWRSAEAAASNQIIRDLAAEGPEAVFLLGDMNDELGYQEFEIEAGGDTISKLVGDGDNDPSNDLVLVTRPLAEGGAISYTGYWRDRYRSFIDQIVATEAGAEKVVDVVLYETPWALVASDHLPVYADVQFGK